MAQLFETILQISLSTAAVIGVLLLLVPLWQKRYSAKWRKAIWFILAVRLLIPFSLELPQAPVQMNMDLQAAPVWQSAVTENAIVNESNVAAMDNAVQTVSNDTANHAVVSDMTVAKELQLSRGQVWALVWLIGAVLFLLAHGVQYVTFRRRVLHNAQPLPEQDRLLQQAADGLNLRSYPTVLLSSKAQGPMLIGFVKSVIILPERIYGEKELSLILRHELVHYSQHDLWYKLVLLLANAAHWFNPLVYLMNRQANRDVEQVCDDKVVANQNMDYRKAYSMTILQAMSSSRGIALSTYLSKEAQNSKKRFADILYPQKYARGLVMLCVVIIAAVGISGCLQVGKEVAEEVVDEEALQAMGVELYEQVAVWLPEGAIENPKEYTMTYFAEDTRVRYIWKEDPVEVVVEPNKMPASYQKNGEKFYDCQRILRLEIDADSKEIVCFEYQNDGEPFAVANDFVPFYEDEDAVVAYRNRFIEAFIPDNEQLQIWEDKNWAGPQAQPKQLCYKIRDEINHYNYEVRLQTETGYVSYFQRDYYNKEWRKAMMGWLAEQYQQNLGEKFNFPVNGADAGTYNQQVIDGQYHIQPISVGVYWQPKMTTTIEQKLEQLRQTDEVQYTAVWDTYQDWYHDETLQLYMTADITRKNELDFASAQLYYRNNDANNADELWLPWTQEQWQEKQAQLQIQWAAASYTRAYCTGQKDAMALFGNALLLEEPRTKYNMYKIDQSEFIKECTIKTMVLDDNGPAIADVQMELHTEDNRQQYLNLTLKKIEDEWMVIDAALDGYQTAEYQG